jgi:hypothetical protein
MVSLLNGVGVSMIICALATAQKSAMAGKVTNPNILKVRGKETGLWTRD